MDLPSVRNERAQQPCPAGPLPLALALCLRKAWSLFDYLQCSYRFLPSFFLCGVWLLPALSGFLSWPRSLGNWRPGVAVCVLSGVLEACHSVGERMRLLAHTEVMGVEC